MEQPLGCQCIECSVISNQSFMPVLAQSYEILSLYHMLLVCCACLPQDSTLLAPDARVVRPGPHSDAAVVPPGQYMPEGQKPHSPVAFVA